MKYVYGIIIIIVAVVILEEIIMFIKKRTPSQREVRMKQEYEDSVVQSKRNISRQEKAARGISDEYINPIVAEIKKIIKKHKANGFIETKVNCGYICVELFDEYGYQTREEIQLRDLKYSPLSYEETAAVAGAIKHRFGSDYVWKRYTQNDDYDGSSFHDYYVGVVKHRNAEQLKIGGIKPF